MLLECMEVGELMFLEELAAHGSSVYGLQDLVEDPLGIAGAHRNCTALKAAL